MAAPTDITDCLDRFRTLVSGILPADDRVDFYANRRTAEGDTYLRLESYAPASLSRLVFEEYEIRGRMHGGVIMAFPSIDTEVPIFFFQLGGVGDRSIAVLDISPTTPDLDLSALAPVHEHYAGALGLPPSTTPWLGSVCSPYLLHCNYAELDRALFAEAVSAYATVWKDVFHDHPVAVASPARADVVRNQLYKFKYQLHHHDPAYEFFVKAWGRPSADAFVDLECSDEPALLPPDLENKVKPWQDSEQRLVWDERAQRAVMAMPDDSQERVRDACEKAATDRGFGIVTAELLSQITASD